MPDQPKIVKEGFLKKRKAKLHQWSQRYFVLTDRTLSYKIKQDSPDFKDSYDLVPGCIVTQIESETRASLKGRRLFSFWVVWPHDKSKVKDDEHHKAIDSDDEKEILNSSNPGKDEGDQPNRTKNLKSIVESEVWEHRKQKNIVEEQIEMHHQRDNNISLGAKVAAVTVGGVIVGALTAGIGLLPYIAVVGVATVAGGGAVVYNWRKPFDSRLIIACDTMEEAVEWRSCIEAQISRLESASRRLNLPSSLDPRVIGDILNRSQQPRFWRRVAAPEGMRILELEFPQMRMNASERRKQRRLLLSQTDFQHRTAPALMSPLIPPASDNSSSSLSLPLALDETLDVNNMRCRRAHISLPTTPLQTFLFLMSEAGGVLGKTRGLTLRTLQQIDDHADALEAEIDFGLILGRQPRQHMRKLYFSRFWSLDDDGVYLVTLCASSAPVSLPNQVSAGSGVAGNTVEYHPVKLDAKKRVYSRCVAPTIHVVLTVSPRADFAEYSFDVHDCILTCAVQISQPASGSGLGETGVSSKSGKNSGKNGEMSCWSEEEKSAFMDVFMEAQMLELREMYNSERFVMHPHLNNHNVSGYMSDSAVMALQLEGTNKYQYPPSPPPSSPPQQLKKAKSVASAAAIAELQPPSSPYHPSVSTSNSTSNSTSTSIVATSVNTSSSTSSGVSVSTPATLPPPGRSARRGVTTVQPGMEDTTSPVTAATVSQGGVAGVSSTSLPPLPQATRSSSGDKTHVNAVPLYDDVGVSSVSSVSSPYATHDTHKPSRTRRVLGLFSRSKTSSAQDFQQFANTSVSHGEVTVSPGSSQRHTQHVPVSREERRQREKDFNTTAKKLRVKIEEKVCELKRVAETMRQASRQGMTLGSGGSTSNTSSNTSSNPANSKESSSATQHDTPAHVKDTHVKDTVNGSATHQHITPAQFALLQDQQGELFAELQQLKKEYLGFTGEFYDEKQATRSRFGRWGRAKTQGVSQGVSQGVAGKSGKAGMIVSPSVSQIIDLSDDETLQGPLYPSAAIAVSRPNVSRNASLVQVTRCPPSFWMQPVSRQDVSRAASLKTRVSLAVTHLCRGSFWRHTWQQLACSLYLDDGFTSDSVTHLRHQRNVSRLGPVSDLEGGVARDTLMLAQALLVLAMVTVGLWCVEGLQPFRIFVFAQLLSILKK